MESFVFRASPPPEWLNAEFVQTALRHAGDDTLTVITCDVKSAEAVNKISCDVYPATATLGNGEQRSLIVKCAARAGTGNQLTQLFDKEIKILTETLPAMESLLKNVSPDEFIPFGPKCYYHGSKPLPFVVLEDLKETGYSYARRHFGLDFAYCCMSLRTLARFHAASIAYFEQNPEKRGYFCENEFVNKFRGPIEKILPNGIACLADVVTNWESFAEFSEKLVKFKEKIINEFDKVFGRKDEYLRCLIHGDNMAMNVMYKLSDNAVAEARLIDFQTVVYTSPVIDLLHYIYGIGNYRVHLFGFETLIKEYHSTFQKTLNLLGHSELAPSKEDFDELLSQYDFYAFYIASTLLPLTVYNPLEETEEESSEGASSQPSIKRMYEGKLYKCLMMNYLLTFDSKGLFT